MANKTLPTRFPVRKLHKKEVFKKMQGIPRRAGGAPMPKHGSRKRDFT